MRGASPRPLRALHICTRYLSGGSERRIADIVAALPEVEHHLLVGSESDVQRARADLRNAHVRHEPHLVRPVRPHRDVAALLRTMKLMRRESFDIVFTHQSKAGAIGRTAAWLAGGLPAVHSLSMANFGPGYGRLENGVFRMLERLLASCTAGYSVVGSDLARRYADNGIPEDKLSIVRSGARIPAAGVTTHEARAAIQARYGIPAGRPLILSLGSLDQRKNVLSLPAYLATVIARSSPRPFLLVAGDGPLRDQLAAALRSAGLADDARLVGHVTPVDDLVVGADVVLLLSSAEGLPQVLLQAAAVGTPFVSYDVDGVAELIELGARGTVRPLHDLIGTAAATVRYVESSPRAAGAPGPPTEALRQALHQWSAVAIAQGHRALFERVMGPAVAAAPSPRARVPRTRRAARSLARPG